MAHPLRGLAPSRHNRFAGLCRDINFFWGCRSTVSSNRIVSVQSLSRLRRHPAFASLTCHWHDAARLHKGAKVRKIYSENREKTKFCIVEDGFPIPPHFALFMRNGRPVLYRKWQLLYIIPHTKRPQQRRGLSCFLLWITICSLISGSPSARPDDPVRCPCQQRRNRSR